MSLYPPLVKLNKDTHEYTDGENCRYMGFSKFCDEFILKSSFNAAGAAYGVAKSKEITAQAVLDKWDEQRLLGMRIDKALENKLNGIDFQPEDNDIIEIVNNVCAEYAEYKSTHCQSVVYDSYYKIGGSPDCFALTSNRQDGQFEMSDFKVFENADNLYDHKGWLKSPLDHLSSTKCIKIVLQLSYYAFQLEKLLNKRCRKLFIHLIIPLKEEGNIVSYSHKKIVVPYMKNDIFLLLEHNKEAIWEYSKKQELSIF